jgi:hypothetical protein
MVREIVVFCDVCFDGDTETRAATIELAVPATQRCTVDLCERHRAELVDPLAKVLTDHGRDVPDPVVPGAAKRGRPSGRVARPRTVTCDLCGSRVVSIDDHQQKMHRAEYFAQHPEFKTAPCPVCQQPYVMPYGLPMHLTRSHPDYQPPNDGGGGGLFMPPAQGGR